MSRQREIGHQLAQVKRMFTPPKGMSGGPPVLRVTAETSFYPKVENGPPKPARARKKYKPQPMPVHVVSVSPKARGRLRG